MKDFCRKCNLLLLNDRERADELCRFCRKKDEEKKRQAQLLKDSPSPNKSL